MKSNAAERTSYDRQLEKAQLLQAKIEWNRKNKLTLIYNSLYGWQHKFNALTKINHATLLMAANQVGKSRTGCAIDAVHLTGEYPEDWEGYKFDFPPLCWLLGYSGEKTRDLLQKKLFGEIIEGRFQGGYIPKEKILDKIPMSGTPRAMREVKVQHVNGIARCQFWSYSQGQHALMGDVVDFYHIDEEPEDAEIYPQVVTRTINGDRGKGGRGILTFTPENGKTELVTQFMDGDLPSQDMLTATWDDAEHMTEEKKVIILANYPVYQQAMRSRGVPLMGAGLIFEIDESLVKCEPFDIPAHYKIINGMDFGWDHPWALIQLAIDEENDVVYVIQAFKRSKLLPHDAWRATKKWCEGVPVAWPQDGLQTRENGKEKRDVYIEEGFDLTDSHATWEGGGVSVHVGLVQLNRLFKTGQLRIFSDLHEVFEELRQYHTRKVGKDEKVEIVKKKDDILDAIRYAYMMRREAMYKYELDMEPEDYEESFDENEYNAMGY